MNVFRHEKTTRIAGDDLLRARDITAGFWEATNGTLSASGALTQPVHSFASGGSQAYLTSGGQSQPLAIIASDGKQTYVGTISFDQSSMTLATAAEETYLGELSVEQFLQLLSSTAGGTTPQTKEASGAFAQRLPHIFVRAQMSPLPFSPSLLPMPTFTGRKYRVVRNVAFDKRGKRVFRGWTKL